MPLTAVATPYGRPALEALHAAVAAHKAGDPLAPVTVVVPTNAVGVSARRLLAGGGLGPLTGAGPGVAALTFVTAGRLAELLGGPRLAATGRRPVSPPVVAAAIRHVLATEPGIFRPVAGHPATEEALVAAHRELGALPPEALGALARASRRAREVVRIDRAARIRLAPRWHDEADLFGAAIDAIGARAPVLDDLGPLCVYLPQRLARPAALLVAAYAAVHPVSVVAGLTGDDAADATVRETVRRLGAELVEPAVSWPPARGTAVLDASDADDEVRAAVREVVGWVRAGVPLERIALLWGAAEPYARLVHEQLAAARIPCHGASARRLSDSLAGRALLGLLALGDEKFRREAVMGWMASVPVRETESRRAPVAAWDRLSKEAGVVGGAADWERRLRAYVAEQAAELDRERARTDGEPRPARYERRIERAERLDRFVAWLVRTLDPAEVPASWSGQATWAKRLLHRTLGREWARVGWPPSEQRAAARVESVLDRLAGLDAVEPAPSPAVFRRTLELELRGGLERHGRFGEGMLVGPVGLGLGVLLDRVAVVGLAEGTFPGHVREDSLLPDRERERAGGLLPLRRDRVADDARALLAVLAATSGERLLCHPRGDLRRSTERVPSRFVLDTAESLGDERPSREALGVLTAPWCRHVPSFAAGIARAAVPATPQEYDLRWLLDTGGDPDAIAAHPLARTDRVLGRALEAARCRSSASFTRFDGNLTGRDLSPFGPEHLVVSPTRLERYARCPFAYFAESILGLEVVEAPEDRLTISPLDTGSLVHEILERFLSSEMAPAAGNPQESVVPAREWDAAARARLRAIADEVCDRFETTGVTGRSLYWQRDRRQILEVLDRFLDADSTRRAEGRSVTIATELAFGVRDADLPAVEYPLRDGRILRFRGAADRVDRTAGGRLVVIDYKTGSPRSFERLGADDPHLGGTRLQLPVYAAAARAAFPSVDPDVPIEAVYWFLDRNGKHRWVGLVLDDEVMRRIDTALATISDLIAAGVFPAHPDEPTTRLGFVSCPWCDPDGLGTRSRHRQWLRKRSDPALAAYVALAEPHVAAEAPA